MDIDKASQNQAAVQALNMFMQRRIGKFLTTGDLMRTLGGRMRNRTAVDVVEPQLEIFDKSVSIRSLKGEPIELFKMTDPLIEQLIHLKPFLVPENLPFFIAWTRNVKSLCSSQQGLESLFAGSYDAEEWFEQKLPSIDPTSPIDGVLQSMQLAKADNLL